MSLWGKLTGWISAPGAKFLCARVPSGGGAGDDEEAAPLVAEQDYFRIWLAEMYLSRSRKWFTAWNPAVHTLVRLQHGEVQIEIPQVVGELKLAGVDQGHLGNVAHLDTPLTTLLPFNGGTIELVAGLLALPGDRGIGGFVDILSNFAGLLAVPQVTAAMAIAQPVAHGIEQLIVSTNGGLHLGMHQSFSGAGGGGDTEHALRPGYVVLMRSDAGAPDADRLSVLDGHLMYEADGRGPAPFTGDDYLLLHFEKRAERDDWEGFSAIATPFHKALEALGDGERDRAEALVRATIAAVLQSADLTVVDRRRVATAIKERFQQAIDLGLAATRDEELPGLAELVAGGMSVEQARALGAPSFDELLA